MGGLTCKMFFFFFICLPCSKRSPKEEAAMLPSSRQLCTFFVPAGFNGPIGNYADYNYADEVLCKYIYIYIWEYFLFDAVAGRQEPTGICIIFLSNGGYAWEWVITFTVADIPLVFLSKQSTTAAIFENEFYFAHLLYAHMDERSNVCALVCIETTT